VALYGSIEDYAGGVIDLPSSDSNPRGVLGALNALLSSHVLGGATNGTTQTSTAFFNELIDLLFTVRNKNEEPSGLIWASKAAQLYAKAYDTTGQPLAMPAAVAEVPRYQSNTIPSYTQGTMANVATDVFAGDWSQLLIGQRLDLTLQVLTERYADEGKIGVLATWRGDVQVARPSAFAVYRALKGA
jgi:HK97 family phage major capsid protein